MRVPSLVKFVLQRRAMIRPCPVDVTMRVPSLARFVLHRRAMIRPCPIDSMRVPSFIARSFLISSWFLQAVGQRPQDKSA